MEAGSGGDAAAWGVAAAWAGDRDKDRAGDRDRDKDRDRARDRAAAAAGARDRDKDRDKDRDRAGARDKDRDQDRDRHRGGDRPPRTAAGQCPGDSVAFGPGRLPVRGLGPRGASGSGWALAGSRCPAAPGSTGASPGPGTLVSGHRRVPMSPHPGVTVSHRSRVPPCQVLQAWPHASFVLSQEGEAAAEEVGQHEAQAPRGAGDPLPPAGAHEEPRGHEAPGAREEAGGRWGAG